MHLAEYICCQIYFLVIILLFAGKLNLGLVFQNVRSIITKCWKLLHSSIQTSKSEQVCCVHRVRSNVLLFNSCVTKEENNINPKNAVYLARQFLHKKLYINKIGNNKLPQKDYFNANRRQNINKQVIFKSSRWLQHIGLDILCIYPTWGKLNI